MSICVTLPFRPYKEPLDWAKEHCPSYITNDVHMDGYNSYDTNKVDYFFGDKYDALMFKLRWI
jgi:hypothetical protein